MLVSWFLSFACRFIDGNHHVHRAVVDDFENQAGWIGFKSLLFPELLKHHSQPERFKYSFLFFSFGRSALSVLLVRMVGKRSQVLAVFFNSLLR